jgi:hypothetical protein
MDGWMDGWMDGRTDGRTDGWMKTMTLNNNQHLPNNEVNKTMSQRRTQHSCELAYSVHRIKGNKKQLREQLKSEHTQRETQVSC